MENKGCIFWGKFDPNGPNCLPLTAHCLDVAQVFRYLVALPAVHRSLERSAGRVLDNGDLDRLAVLAMLHNVGKANLGFQFKVFDPKAPCAGHVHELAPLFERQELNHCFAQSLDIETLGRWVSSPETLESLLLASWSHHGQPLYFQGARAGNYYLAETQWWKPSQGWDPFMAIADVVLWARKAFPRAFGKVRYSLPDRSCFHHRFAGLVILADWLGSHADYFPIERVNLGKRQQHNHKHIPKVLSTIGLDVTQLQPVLARAPQTFEARFEFPPHPLQEAVHLLDPENPATRLLIAESETGSGKPEAALDWFFTLFAAGKIDALYFALPTRVAARELYGRIHGFMERWFCDPANRPVTLLAVPGYAQVDGLPPERVLPDETNANRWQGNNTLCRRERLWAAEHPKRFLAATIAVGTIDQALLSIIQTAHAHLRSETVTFTELPYAFTPERIAEWIAPALEAHARVLVIMNTVTRANGLLWALESQLEPIWLFRCAEMVCPHHGRFAPVDRLLLDQAVSARLGKNSEPGPVLLIGTQTLEQSLDIDADLLISDLCPADVLLQRVGRLHRHARSRPLGFETPRCLVLVPGQSSLEDALDDNGQVNASFKRLGYGSVYEDLRILELTRRVLGDTPIVAIPKDNRRLVEAANHPDQLTLLNSERWQRHAQTIEGQTLAKELQAQAVLMPLEQLFGEFAFNEAGGKVTTRLGVDSLRLSLDQEITSPFGQRLNEMIVPGHLVAESAAETMNVAAADTRNIWLHLHNEKRQIVCTYRYSRFGLEKEGP
jgi:CRISPR-associated endonuclease Cas3-HD